MAFGIAPGLCRARLQAGIRLSQECPSECGRYTNPSHINMEREYDLPKPFSEEAQT